MATFRYCKPNVSRYCIITWNDNFVQNGKKAYVWVTLIPTVGLLIVTMTAGYQKLFHENPKIGFLSHAKVFQGALDEGKC